MPRLTNDGQIVGGCSGGGAGVGSINNRAISGWERVSSIRVLDDARLIAVNDKTQSTETYDYINGEFAVVGGPANWVEAGDGKWATRLASNPPVYTDSYGRNENNDWRPEGASSYGILVTGYQSGRGARLLRGKDEPEVTLIDSNTPIWGGDGALDDKWWVVRLSPTEIRFGNLQTYASQTVTVPRSVEISLAYPYVLMWGHDQNNLIVVNLENNTFTNAPVSGETFLSEIKRVGSQLTIAYGSSMGEPIGTMSKVTFNPASAAWKPVGYWEDEPPQNVPQLPRANHPIHVQAFGGPGFKMNLGDKHDRDSAAAPSGSFVTIDVDTEAAVNAQADYARTNNVPFFQYMDRPTSDWRTVEVKDLTNMDIPTLKSYPDKPWDQFVEEFESLCARYHRVAVVIAGYRQMIGHGPQMNWKLVDVLRRWEDVWYNIATRPQVTDVLVFHQRRVGQNAIDGLDSRRELQELYNRTVVAGDVKLPDEPDSEPDIPVVEDPVTPIPPTPSEPSEPAKVPDTITQPPYDPPVAHRPTSPTGGNALMDFFRMLRKINFRKWFT